MEPFKDGKGKREAGPTSVSTSPIFRSRDRSSARRASFGVWEDCLASVSTYEGSQGRGAKKKRRGEES